MITEDENTAVLIELAIESGYWADWQKALRAIRVERGTLVDGRRRE